MISTSRLNLRSLRRLPTSILLCPLLLAGCGRAPEIRTYEVPPNELSVPFSCTVPESWKLLPNDQFSILAFGVSGDPTAKMTITRLRRSGDGYVLANANRWNRQLGLPPLENESDLPEVEFANRTGRLVAIEGNGKAIRAAIVEHLEQPWTFRLSGPSKQVSAAAEQFDAFLRTVEFFEVSGDN